MGIWTLRVLRRTLASGVATGLLLAQPVAAYALSSGSSDLFGSDDSTPPAAATAQRSAGEGEQPPAPTVQPKPENPSKPEAPPAGGDRSAAPGAMSELTRLTYQGLDSSDAITFGARLDTSLRVSAAEKLSSAQHFLAAVADDPAVWRYHATTETNPAIKRAIGLGPVVGERCEAVAYSTKVPVRPTDQDYVFYVANKVFGHLPANRANSASFVVTDLGDWSYIARCVRY